MLSPAGRLSVHENRRTFVVHRRFLPCFTRHPRHTLVTLMPLAQLVQSTFKSVTYVGPRAALGWRRALQVLAPPEDAGAASAAAT